MNISGIRPYEGFYEYNSINASEVRSKQIAASQMSGSDLEGTAGEAAGGALAQIVRPEQSYTAYDYAQTYQPMEGFEMKGTDSDIYSLDTQKVLSDLDKDHVLQQYQYFVGDSGSLSAQAESAGATLRSGENFSL